MSRLLLAVPVLLLSSCAVVKASTVRDDWAEADQKNVKRLAVVVQPLPAGDEVAGQVFARVARRYVNQKRDFLVKAELSQAEPVTLEATCGGEDAIEGVLFLRPMLVAKGEGFEATLTGSLARCGDGRPAWTVDAGGSFPSTDPRLAEVTQVYVQEFGPGAARFVAPAFNLLRPALDTLPQPVLTEADVDEKLTLD